MDKQAVEAQLCQLPISQYAWIDPQTIEFSDRIRYVCEHDSVDRVSTSGENCRRISRTCRVTASCGARVASAAERSAMSSTSESVVKTSAPG